MHRIIQFFRNREKGQSMVEIALFLPILVIVIAGTVEVSQLVNTKNRVATASRNAARFGANGGENDGMSQVVVNTVTQTLSIDENVWDLWAIRAEVNDAGDGFDEWEFDHVYGISNTVLYTHVNEADIQNRVLSELQTGVGGAAADAAGLRVAGNYAIHDVDTILGLSALPGLDTFNSVDALSVMRVVGNIVEQTNGCTAFPIAVHEGIRSVTRPGEGSNPYPDASSFDYPDGKQGAPPPPEWTAFPNNPWDSPVGLADAQEGALFKVQNGFGNGNFGWLAWNNGISANANTLRNSLRWPGDSNDYADHGDGGQPAADEYPWVVRGYVEPGDPTDTSIHIGDWVAVKTGSVSSVGSDSGPNNPSPLKQMADLAGRTVRLIVWDQTTGSGSNGQYQISGFAIFKIHGYKLNQGGGEPSWILAEFVRNDESCGQPSP